MFVGPGEGAPHGTLQEHGTEHHAPQPFLTPAWEQLKHAVLEKLKIEMWEAIKRRHRLNANKAAREAKKAEIAKNGAPAGSYFDKGGRLRDAEGRFI